MKIITKAALFIAPIVLCTSGAFAADAAANWTQYCASCHGKDGSGNTTMGKKLGVKDYTKDQSFSDADAEKAIKEGVKDGGKEKMKAYKDKLSDADVKALVAYTRSLKK
jgi:mono/diheme cytochrome c family protein